jgi:phosphoserine aminotransferase
MSAGRVFNFSPGPCTLPLEIMETAAAEYVNWHGTGLGVTEMSHRSPEFTSIYDKCEADLRELMGIPDNYKVLFM